MIECWWWKQQVFESLLTQNTITTWVSKIFRLGKHMSKICWAFLYSGWPKQAWMGDKGSNKILKY